MARGWESKSVEEQMEAAVERKQRPPVPALSSEQADVIRKKDLLLLSRIRVLHDLDQAQNPRYRKILEQALAHLDAELQKLNFV